MLKKVEILFHYNRVCTDPGKPGKSWNITVAFSRTGSESEPTITKMGLYLVREGLKIILQSTNSDMKSGT